ncbi:ABC-type multidrug transport system, ATPase component (plasmid) [Natrarchaeobaculum sulfurireducens]|uniref:ABC transporter ATP-binding protein n=2 Tax=Natrarchaeobaculum sulfurireducens TaxID=2044521 RepID=A0A346P9V2_9EURY|nr:ABC transporter ATP-binding protein [Natrarchaeobaculum sulfurireducens]AXR79985.1 ABC-type multidrug transport system, ATPase component [Natrarchaeobaculum sulfurireducens]
MDALDVSKLTLRCDPHLKMTNTNYAIETSGLTKRFGTTVAVDGVDLSVPEGSVYGFLGPNGAGKTTTMRMLTSLTKPTSGDAWIEGNPVSDRDAIRASIGYLPEDPPVFDELTGLEQLEYFARLRDIPPDEADQRIDHWMDRFDLTADAGKRIDDYSKGMRQKVGLIQALLHEPAVVFLDEPTSGLDPRAARTVLDVITEVTAAGQTVFLSTHILSVVEELADLVGVLYEGRLVTEGTPIELTAQVETDAGSTLEDVFLAVTTDRATSPDV